MASSRDLQSAQEPSAFDGPIRVIMPAEVAFSLGSIQKGLASLARRLGCGECISGRSCVFTLERDFVINPGNREVEPLAERQF